LAGLGLSGRGVDLAVEVVREDHIEANVRERSGTFGMCLVCVLLVLFLYADSTPFAVGSTAKLKAMRGTFTNGAAARKAQVGDLLIICTYAPLLEAACIHHRPRVVLLGEGNAIAAIKDGAVERMNFV
jgi:hypothetical protein